MSDSNEAYFVGSNGNIPEKMHFDRAKATACEYQFIDSFDANGEKVASYEFVGDNHISLDSDGVKKENGMIDGYERSEA